LTEHGCDRTVPIVAAAIACTEDQVAGTLERMAVAMPEDAARLRALAAQARRFATLERSRAAEFGSGPSRDTGTAAG
jgi:hypothetical protein